MSRIQAAASSGGFEVSRLRRTGARVFAALAALLLIAYSFSAYLIYQRAHLAAVEASAPAQPNARDETASLSRADSLLAAHKVEQALLVYREVLSSQPWSVPAQLGLAKGEILAGRENAAARDLETLLRTDPHSQPALLEIARIYSHQRQTWQRADVRYRQYLELAPRDSQARLELARVCAWNGRAADTAALYERPDVAPRMTFSDERNYAFALVKLERWTEAESLLKRLVAAHPGDTGIELQLASLYARNHNWDAAVPIYRVLLARSAGDPQVNLSYGMALLSLKNYPAAVQPLARACSAMPGDGMARLSYARALKGNGDLKAAVHEYGRAVNHFAGDPQVVREYADALLEKHDYHKSSEYYGIAYRQGLRDERLLLGYSGALSGAGRDKEALPYLEEVYRSDPTGWVTLQLARVMKRLGRYNEARDLLRKIETHSASTAAGK